MKNNEKRIYLKEFIDRLLKEFLKQEVTEFKRIDFQNFLAQLFQDERFSSVTHLTKTDFNPILFLETLTNLLSNQIIIMKSDKKMAIINQNKILEDTQYYPELNDEEQMVLSEIVNYFKTFTAANEPLKIGSIEVYRKFSNDFYAICTNVPKGISKLVETLFEKIAREKQEAVSWNLLTNGNVKYSKTMSEFNSNCHSYSYIHPEQNKKYEAKVSRYVSVENSDFVAIQGYVDNILKYTFLYTMLDEKKIKDLIELISHDDFVNCLTSEQPHVRILKQEILKFQTSDMQPHISAQLDDYATEYTIDGDDTELVCRTQIDLEEQLEINRQKSKSIF